MTNSIAKAGVYFAVYLFIMVTVFFVLSAPVNYIFDGFLLGEYGLAQDEMNTFVPLLKGAVQMAFAICLAAPLMWFVMWVFHREPDVSRYRRY